MSLDIDKHHDTITTSNRYNELFLKFPMSFYFLFIYLVVRTLNSRSTFLTNFKEHHFLLFSCSVMSDSLWTHELQHAWLPCPSPSSRACSNSCPLSRWCHPTISSSVVPFSSCPQSFPASRSFLMSWLFASGGQSIGASTSVPLMNIQDWFPLGLTGLISLQSKGLSRVFSNTTAQKRQFFSIQPSLWSNSHIYTWLLGKPYHIVNYRWYAE